MSRVWRKGCLCGCLYEEECSYYEAPARRVEHVHVVHVVHREEPRAVEYVDAEVEVVREIEP